MQSRSKLGFLILCYLALAVPTLAQKKFPYDKEAMPFNAPAVKRDIDEDCSDEGTGKGDAQRAQNRAKNNFAAKGKPVPILITDIDRLEKATIAARNCFAKHGTKCKQLAIDPDGLPIDRKQLRDIATTGNGVSLGEGTIVVLEAKVLDSHYSNTKYNLYKNKGKPPSRGSGESVNCKNKLSSEIDRNDIHIVLAAPGEKNDCMSVTAEISPHFRPDAWRRFHNMGQNSLGEDINLEAKGVDFKKIQMVRITGPLFYDASHEPCSPGHRSSPARRSLWEIHPAYKLEVKNKGVWQTFDEWANTQ
jgi:hypothetical protein